MAKMILSQFFTAIPLPNALPPTVRVETPAATIRAQTACGRDVLLDINRASVVPRAPLRIPHMSPMMSLHTLDTFEAERMRLTHTPAPLIFLDAFAWKVASFPERTATPIISVMIPMSITITNITVVRIMFMSDINVATPEKQAESVNVRTNTRIIHLILSFNYFTHF